MVNENENLNSLKKEKTTLEEELNTLDSEADVDRVNEINERLNPLKDEILSATEEQNKQLFNRAKKAEGFEEVDGKWVKKPEAKKEPEAEPAEQPKQERLSDADLIVLAKADIHQDDIPEVLEYAKFKKIPVAEALKSSVMKASLAEKEEQRKVADATSVKTSRRGSSKTSDEQKLADLEAGKLPEDPVELARLASLQRRQKRN